MTDLDLEVIDSTPEENEFFSIVEQNNFTFDGDVTLQTKYKDLNMFADDRWKRLRFYLDEMLWDDDIDGINDQRYRIVNELRGLEVFTEDDVQEFNRILDAALRLIELSPRVFR